MRKMFLMLASVAVLAISCAKQGDDPKQENPIVGEWSGIMEGDKLNNENVRIHFNFKADGTYEQIMPAWEEKKLWQVHRFRRFDNLRTHFS